MIQIRKLQDINIGEVKLKEKYYNEFINGNINEANKIINNNPELKFKVINSENLNALINGIMMLENNYYNNVDNILNDHLTKYQFDIDELIYLKEYKQNEQYEINNFVSYNGDIYYCKLKPNIGTLPTDTTYWIKLGLKGEDGLVSLGVVYKGNWSSAISYNKYDAIVYQNNMYVAKKDNFNANPISDTLSWSLQMHVEEQGIYVSNIAPPNIKQGNIWIQII